MLAEDLRVATRRDAIPGGFAVIGMGKLGGMELNYSSDIDLVYVYTPADPDASADHEFFHTLARRLTKALSDHTTESYLYRVDRRAGVRWGDTAMWPARCSNTRTTTRRGARPSSDSR